MTTTVRLRRSKPAKQVTINLSVAGTKLTEFSLDRKAVVELRTQLFEALQGSVPKICLEFQPEQKKVA